jgi:hypothetical protein
MKSEVSLADIAAAAIRAAGCECDPWCCAPAAVINPGMVVARDTPDDRKSPPPTRAGGASVVLWRHLRSEFAASEATEGRLTWLVWSAGLATIGCFLAAML